MGGPEGAHCPGEDRKLFKLNDTVCVSAPRKTEVELLSSNQGLGLKVFANRAGMENRC